MVIIVVNGARAPPIFSMLYIFGSAASPSVSVYGGAQRVKLAAREKAVHEAGEARPQRGYSKGKVHTYPTCLK